MRDRPLAVLLVEDDPDDVITVRRTLENGVRLRGVKLETAERLSSAIQRLREGGLDAVLLDLDLPDSSGLDTLAAVLGADRETPVVVLTGLDDEEVATEALHGGAQDYLVKGEFQGGLLVRCLSHAAERRRAEQELRASQRQLRALAARLQRVREEERALLARAIHDELGHDLVALKFDLAWCRKGMRRPPDVPAEGDMAQRIDGMCQAVDATIRSVRDIAGELRPVVLDDLGLLAAIEWEVQRFQERTGIRCEIGTLAEDLKLDAERSTALFRIFQEILTNVAQHAHASKVTIRLGYSDGGAMLEVTDDGKGITKEALESPRSLGILGMRERALVFGGEVSITGKRGKGTAVIVRIPLAAKQ